jgi:hypothetical protein
MMFDRYDVQSLNETAHETRARCRRTSGVAAGILASVVLVGATARAVEYPLDNGPGDGTVDLGVDGYGSLGFDIGYDDYYDPIGVSVPDQVSTIYRGYPLIRTSEGRFYFVGDAAGSPSVTGTATSASSSFTDVTSLLSFDLTQVVTPLWNGSTRIGSLLTQTYAIQNPTASTVSFDLARWIDADIRYDHNISDGGGRMVVNGLELLFETDTATGTASSPVVLAITGEGGTIPASGRYELSRAPTLLNTLLNTGVVGDTVQNDGADPDQIIDTGMGYDASMVLINRFVLGPGESDTYVTRTYFVSVDLPEPGPLPSLGFGITGLLALRALRGRRSSRA